MGGGRHGAARDYHRAHGNSYAQVRHALAALTDPRPGDKQVTSQQYHANVASTASTVAAPIHHAVDRQ